MPGPPPHQLAIPSTLEYRPPPRRAYAPGPVHAAVVPGIMDESGLGLLISDISYESYTVIFQLLSYAEQCKLQWACQLIHSL